ncbi:hypothetical protein ACFQZO_12625 [Bradyrhizobium sp. GCM10027634]|nr:MULTISPECIES: hypothetical protein [unclassified Bradyrhizobium]MDN5001729.1 hypothetical protein [Bradyrhizobium sp. WYCCWR 12677]
MQTIIAILCGGLLVGFIVFAFVQGMKVTPKSSENGSNDDNKQLTRDR